MMHWAHQVELGNSDDQRAGTRIDADVAWALLAVEADRRRRARHARIAASPRSDR